MNFLSLQQSFFYILFRINTTSKAKITTSAAPIAIPVVCFFFVSFCSFFFFSSFCFSVLLFLLSLWSLLFLFFLVLLILLQMLYCCLSVLYSRLRAMGWNACRHFHDYVVFHSEILPPTVIIRITDNKTRKNKKEIHSKIPVVESLDITGTSKSKSFKYMIPYYHKSSDSSQSTGILLWISFLFFRVLLSVMRMMTVGGRISL